VFLKDVVESESINTRIHETGIISQCKVLNRWPEAMIPQDAFVLAVYLHGKWKEFSI
jgi:hypothetical protein